jgi:hypothetical protein
MLPPSLLARQNKFPLHPSLRRKPAIKVNLENKAVEIGRMPSVKKRRRVRQYTRFLPEPADFRFLQKNGAPVLMGQANLIHRGKVTSGFLGKFKVVTLRKLLYIW